MMWPLLLALLGGAAATPAPYRPCAEVARELRLPCQCALEPEASDGGAAISVDCDHVVFAGDFPSLPLGAPIVSFRQRHAGCQAPPTQAFAAAALPLRSLDFSGNALRRLGERLLSGLQERLLELRLADNLLGDTLNPIFATSELHGLRRLRLLDLSGNAIRGVEAGILEGCAQLQELLLDRNSLAAVPGASLNGPAALRVLGLRENRITAVAAGAFQAQRGLAAVDLGRNLIASIEGGAFERLERLRSLALGHNRLARLNSDVFQGAERLQQLDLSENFIREFPAVALKAFASLRSLNLSSNLIQSLDNAELLSVASLHQLDLSRNNVANIVPGTFLGLKQLRRLDISVNSLRTIEDDAFEGLDSLEHLSLADNNILLVPASALGRLPRLAHLQLDYNRVAALSGDILRSVAERVATLVLARNVVRELPPATFQRFRQLQHLDLARNLLAHLSADTFAGLEHTLLTLSAAQNRISALAGAPLALAGLQSLDLSDNRLGALAPNAFAALPALAHLNLSGNARLGDAPLPPRLLHELGALRVVDLSRTGLRALPSELLAQNARLAEAHLSDNALTELPDGAFLDLRNLTVVDLSRNRIASIRPGAFVNVMNLRELRLAGNALTSFKGEFFNTGTSLEVLDIAHNQLSYLFPSSFRIHPRLRAILAAHNKFNFFPAELVATLQYLAHVDLTGNALKAVEELDFARLPRLRTLRLGHNRIESVSEMAFHNSTQLQVIELQHNSLERLGERTFEGLARIERLNLEGNQLADLPEAIFERARLHMLENINLARNRFEHAPFRALQRQYFFVDAVDLSRNRIREVPPDDSTMVNIKRLDLSFNPLSDAAVASILGEPKTVRELNLAGTGIREVARLETPFLRALNLSHNNISALDSQLFERTTLLETLDVSGNRIADLSRFPSVWRVLKNLQAVSIAGNPIATVGAGDLEGLQSLRCLSLSDLPDCTRIEKTAFRATPRLSALSAFNYPKLGYLDLPGLLQHLPALERVNIEVKDAAVGSEQLQSVLHPRLRELGLHGARLRSVSSGTLSGLKGRAVVIRLANTSLTALPPALFFPVPRSSRVDLDVAGSQLTTLNPQLLATLDDRRGDLQILGLETNPVICDCGARALRRWLPARMAAIRCAAPEHLLGRLLVEVGDDELTCDPRKVASASTAAAATTTTSTTSTAASVAAKNTRPAPATTEPEIIWSVAATEKARAKPTPRPATGAAAIGNDDTLIIGIVGGVVAFITILIIVICIIRLRMTGNQYRGGPLAANGTPVMGPPVLGPGSTCATCSVKGAAPMYAVPPPYAPGYAATLPHKMNMSGPPAARTAYSTISRVPYAQPYFIATYPSDEKIYR